ncbi:head maturation protease, ClpP-related [Planctomyces sp. SH-PL14]|uniref:head maturation protease, ClpP-related n=1 Tax=Planctomyces sp. SH-PL14 TaxID=1632864 RepID=UPI00078C33ED|nr:head maturation protease, ClpP-related [Planctomyces sp. SH-PL14]AMV20418.1 ATP-dependent Clp protease proteolytic subunit [Planctomyces sp. SH-PL14]
MKTILNAEKSEILIYDVIGEGFFYGGVSAKAVKAALRDLGPKDVTVRINSPGGSIFEANAIYNLLKEHEGKVTTIIDSLAASAASYIAMVGETRKIAANAMIMIHEPAAVTFGDAAEHQKTAGLLEKLRDVIVNMYRDRSGIEDQQLRSWMLDETWFTADESKEHGFVDEILPNVGEKTPKEATARWNLSNFRNVPANWLAANENAATPRLDRMAERLAVA